MKITHVKIKADGPKPHVALFRRDNNELHLILSQDVDCDEDSKMSYDDDRYELVRAATLEEMLIGGKKITAEKKKDLKDLCPEVWNDNWESL